MLQDHKSACILPAVDVGRASLGLGGLLLTSLIRREHGSMEVLGAALGGRFGMSINIQESSSIPAMKRAQQAAVVCARLEDMVRGAEEEHSKAAAWTMLSRSAARRLDYDSRMCPYRALIPAAAALTTAVRNTMDCLKGSLITDEEFSQCALPTYLGGFALRPIDASHCHAAFWASWSTSHVDAGRVAEMCGLPRSGQHEKAFAEEAAAALRSQGIVVDSGALSFTPAAEVLYGNGPWSQDIPPQQVFCFANEIDDRRGAAPALEESGLVAFQALVRTDGHIVEGRRRIAGRISRGIAALRATHLWHSLPQRKRANFLSRGGYGAGACWTACFEPEVRISDNLWTIAVRRRLGADIADEGARCQHAYSGEPPEGAEPTCGKLIDPSADHPLSCPIGPHRIRLHNEVAQLLGDTCKKHHAHVDFERRAPHLYAEGADGSIIEAILDVVVRWPLSPARRWIDVTLRHACGIDIGAAATRPGAAAAEGEKRKANTYGDTVVAASMEIGGRMGPQMMNLIADIAAEARRATLRRRGWSPRGVARLLAFRISAIITAGEAEIVEAALPRPLVLRLQGEMAPQLAGTQGMGTASSLGGVAGHRNAPQRIRGGRGRGARR